MARKRKPPTKRRATKTTRKGRPDQLIIDEPSFAGVRVPYGVPIPKREDTYVTREMLADLRDEIEGVLQDARRTVEYAERRIKSVAEYEPEHKVLRDVRDIKMVLGLDLSRPYLGVLAEPVAWSYFHVWIARINERLDAIERKLAERATP